MVSNDNSRQDAISHTIALAYFSADRLLASVCETHLILWEPLAGAAVCKQSLPPSGKANAVAFAEDGSHVLVAGRDIYKVILEVLQQM
jgi:hypothetical protein